MFLRVFGRYVAFVKKNFVSVRKVTAGLSLLMDMRMNSLETLKELGMLYLIIFQTLSKGICV